MEIARIKSEYYLLKHTEYNIGLPRLTQIKNKSNPFKKQYFVAAHGLTTEQNLKKGAEKASHPACHC